MKRLMYIVFVAVFLALSSFVNAQDKSLVLYEILARKPMSSLMG